MILPLLVLVYYLKPNAPDERPPLGKLLHQLVNLSLQAFGGHDLPLSISRGDDVAVLDQDFHQAVGEIFVSLDPILDGPALGVEDCLHKEHVGNGVSDGLEKGRQKEHHSSNET